MQALHIHLLGDFSLSYAGETVTTLTSPRLQSLFAYLVLHRDAPHSRRSLSFLFWPDSDESQARTNLRKLIYDLRRDLPEAERFVDIEGKALRWRAEAPFTLDVEEFETAARQANTSDALKDALEEYTGDLLPSCYEDWILLERQRLFQIFIDALERLISMLEAEEDYRSAISYTQRLVNDAPLQEDHYRRLMRLYALNGDRAGVLRTYHACATTLQRELQVEPSQVTRQAYERWLNLDGPLSQLPAANPSLVGRSREWAQLQASWRAALAGPPQWVFLTGEDGVGKTRLAEELLQWAARQGIATASTQCYVTDAGMAFATVTALLRARPLPPLNKLWLAEVARLLPEILVDHPHISQPGPLNQPWQRHRFFEALARVMLTSQPLLLMVDDLQWCDPESLEWMAYLLRFDPQAQLLLVSTLSRENLAAGHPLNALITTLQRAKQMTEIELKPLSESDTTLLASRAAQDHFHLSQAQQIFKETQGNPLFTLEMLRAGPSPNHLAEPSPLPPTVKSAIETRLERLSPEARNLTGVAATMGRAFTLDMLAQASGVNEEDLVRGLDELWQQQIVRQRSAQAYDFSHSKFSEVAYAGLSEAQRKALHRKVAEALEATEEVNLDLISAEIGDHYERAGLPEKAVSYYLRAGDAARRIYANEAAILQYQHALSLLPDKDQVNVLLRLGEVWQLVGDWDQAETLYRQALHLAQGTGDARAEAHCCSALGEVLQLKSEYDEALDWQVKARDTFLSLGDSQGLSRVLASMGSLYYWRLDYPRALECHERQLQIAAESGDQQEASRANGNLGLIFWQQGSYARAMDRFERQLQIANLIGDLSAIGSALGRMGLVFWARGKAPQALALFERQLSIGQETGHRLEIGYALGNIGNVYRDQGDYARALGYYARQLQVTRGLGDRRDLSHAYRRMGRVYALCGEDERALACFAQSLQIALEIGTRRTVARSVGGMALLDLAQDRLDRAERLFELALDLVPVDTLPYNICEYLYYDAVLFAIRGKNARAQSLNTRALHLAAQIERRDIQYEAQVLAPGLQVETRQLEVGSAVASLQRLLKEWKSEHEQAGIHYEIWRLNPGKELDQIVHQQAAADLYRKLYSLTPRWLYRRRYRELTGERLPDPPPLPEPPEEVMSNPADLEDLLDRVDHLRLTLEQMYPASL